jgi:hypothetical protein
LQAEEQSEGEDFGATVEHGAGYCGGGQSFANEFVGDQGEGNSG